MCNYPFVFDAKAKTLLLEADQNIQMQAAMQEAASRAFFPAALLSRMTAGAAANLQFLILEVRRDSLVNDTINQLSMLATSDLKKPLKVVIIYRI